MFGGGGRAGGRAQLSGPPHAPPRGCGAAAATGTAAARGACSAACKEGRWGRRGGQLRGDEARQLATATKGASCHRPPPGAAPLLYLTAKKAGRSTGSSYLKNRCRSLRESVRRGNKGRGGALDCAGRGRAGGPGVLGNPPALTHAVVALNVDLRDALALPRLLPGAQPARGDGRQQLQVQLHRAQMRSAERKPRAGSVGERPSARHEVEFARRPCNRPTRCDEETTMWEVLGPRSQGRPPDWGLGGPPLLTWTDRRPGWEECATPFSAPPPVVAAKSSATASCCTLAPLEGCLS